MQSWCCSWWYILWFWFGNILMGELFIYFFTSLHQLFEIFSTFIFTVSLFETHHSCIISFLFLYFDWGIILLIYLTKYVYETYLSVVYLLSFCTYYKYFSKTFKYESQLNWIYISEAFLSPIFKVETASLPLCI